MPKLHLKFLDFLFLLDITSLLVLYLHLYLEDLALLSLIQLEAPIIHSLLVTRFLWEINLTLGGNLNLGVNPKSRHNLNLGVNLRLESITHCMDRMHLQHKIYLGTFLSKDIHNYLGENILKDNNNLIFPMRLMCILLMDKMFTLLMGNQILQLIILRTHQVILHIHMFLNHPQIMFILVSHNQM